MSRIALTFFVLAVKSLLAKRSELRDSRQKGAQREASEGPSILPVLNAVSSHTRSHANAMLSSAKDGSDDATLADDETSQTEEADGKESDIDSPVDLAAGAYSSDDVDDNSFSSASDDSHDSMDSNADPENLSDQQLENMIQRLRVFSNAMDGMGNLRTRQDKKHLESVREEISALEAIQQVRICYSFYCLCVCLWQDQGSG